MRETALHLWEQTKRNHGLEHATIALLLGRRGQARPMAGYSIPAGFLVVGGMDSTEVEDAAREALRRLQGGESELAVSPFCGTNIVVGAGMATIAALAGSRLGGGGLSGLSRAFSSTMLAVAASRPVGRLVQQRFTTSPDAGSMSIEDVTGVDLGKISAHWVETSFGGTREVWGG